MSNKYQRALAFGVAVATLGSIVEARPTLIGADDFGKQWPFSFEEGYLHCYKHLGNAVTIEDAESGIEYALNGTASTVAKRGSPIKVKPVDSVWLDNSAIPGTKISTNAVLDKGLKLCK